MAKTPKKRPAKRPLVARAGPARATPKRGVAPKRGPVGKAAAAPARPAAKPVRPAMAVVPSGTSARGLAQFGDGNLAAVVQANTVLVKGFEAIGHEVFAYAQTAFEGAVKTAQAMIGARTVVDVIALNREFAQTSLEGLLANSVRVSEIGMRATSEAFAPLGERVTRAMARMTAAKPARAAA
jgi:phasin family protein